MAMKISDHIHGPSRGNANLAISNIDGPEQIDLDYIAEVYRYAPLVTIDPAIVLSQWHVETGGGTSARWRVNGNPAGLLISQPGDPDPAKWNGTEAARVHIFALMHAADPTVIPDWAFLPASARSFVERWTAKYNDPNCPAVSSIDDLNIRYTDDHDEAQATWAWDDQYQDLIVARSKTLFGNALPDQGASPPPPGGAYATSIPGLPGGSLVTNYPIYINLIPAGNTSQRPGTPARSPRRSVQHGTGNPSNSDAAAEARYFVNGAEGRRASIHYCTDDTKAMVVVPLSEVTWQAADGAGPGNMNGFSCEMMESTAIWQNPGRRDKLIAITADLMGRTAARLGATKPERHWDFNAGSADRHHCPDKLMTTGLWDTVYVPSWHAARADELRRMSGGTITSTTTTPAPNPWPAKRIAAPDTLMAQGNTLVPNTVKRFICTQGGRFKTGPSLDAPDAVATPYKASETRRYTFDYSTTVDGRLWLVAKSGSWAPAQNFRTA